MKLLIHALIVSAVFFGTDLAMNDGAETTQLLRKLDAQVVWHQVKAQNYHVTARVAQEVYAARPNLTLARMN